MFEMKLWHAFSAEHARSATLLSRMCGELEASPPTPTAQELVPGHKAYALSSLFSTVAFLEALVNEVIGGAGDDELPLVKGLAPSNRSAISDLQDFLDRASLLDRVQLVLVLAGKEHFDRGRSPFQNAQLVVKLRNALVHYKPSWRGGGVPASPQGEEERLVATLSGKFPLSPFFAETGNPFFPDHCLSHGCTSWTWNSILGFADEFCSRLAIEPPYSGDRAILTP
jgi:hypothetical protein